MINRELAKIGLFALSVLFASGLNVQSSEGDYRKDCPTAREWASTIERGNWYIGSGFGLVSNKNITVGRAAYLNDFGQTAPNWSVHEVAYLVPGGL
ncbi:MAG: hypothetical protein AAFX02_07410 [Pseudomonadota bacterium]